MKNERMGARGFSLVEVIVAMGIGLMVLGSLYSVFAMQNRTLSLQDQIVGMQENARAGMEIMLRDIRMAGYNPTKTINWVAGTRPGLTYAMADSLSFVADLNGNGDTTAGSSNAGENITYEKYEDGGVSCLGRTSNGERHPVVENIESLVFAYYDRNGNAMSIPPALPSVRKIKVSITAKTALPDPSYRDPDCGDNYRRYCLTFDVTPRNLGL